jgi:hypothetical protein
MAFSIFFALASILRCSFRDSWVLLLFETSKSRPASTRNSEAQIDRCIPYGAQRLILQGVCFRAIDLDERSGEL